MVNMVWLQVLNGYSDKCPIGRGHLEFINIWLFAYRTSRDCNRIVSGYGQSGHRPDSTVFGLY